MKFSSRSFQPRATEGKVPQRLSLENREVPSRRTVAVTKIFVKECEVYTSEERHKLMRLDSDVCRVCLIADVFLVFRIYNLIYAGVVTSLVVELLP